MIRLSRLPNGIRLVTEKIDAVHSCGIGLWLEVGSRHERPGELGLTHFIEHMFFKGTSRLDALALSEAMNLLGGNINAFTSQEMLCLHARTISHKAPQALDLLCEMLIDSQFPPDEIRRERQVILEEYSMLDDTPDESCIDLFMRNLWPDDPLGRPIIGRRDDIRSFNRQRIHDYLAREFHPSRLIVALAGNFDTRACDRVIASRLAPLRAGRRPPRPAPLAPSAPPALSARRRPVEQVHFCLGTVCPPRHAADRFAFGMMNMVLGGGTSSRLFQEIREKRGLAYSISSFYQSFSDAGFFAVSGGTSPDTLRPVLEITHREIQRIIDNPVSQNELELARAQVLDAIVIGLENMETRMTRLADSLIIHGRVLSVEEIMDRVQRVKVPDILRCARRYLTRPYAMGLVGPRWSRTALRDVQPKGDSSR